MSALQPLPDVDPELADYTTGDEYIDSHQECEHAYMEHAESECGCSWDECPDCGRLEYMDVCREHGGYLG